MISDVAPAAVQPDPNCPKCHGRGYRKFLNRYGSYSSQTCDCLFKARREARVTAMIRAARIPLLFKGADLAEFHDSPENEAARNLVRAYAAQPLNQGETLLFQGGTGIGKTYLACVVLKDQIRNFLIPGLYLPTLPFFSAMMPEAVSAEERRKLKEAASTTPIVLFDDLGTENPSEYVMRTLYEVVDARYREMLTNLITTNVILKDWLTQASPTYGPRIYSRLRVRSDPVRWDEPDFRAKQPSRRKAAGGTTSKGGEAHE